MMTGFNPTIVSESIHNVEEAYNELMNALYGKTQSDFVNAMGDIWACQLAINYFGNTFKPGVDQLLADAYTNFATTVQVMNTEAMAWAQKTLYDGWSSIDFGGERKELDIAAIKENINDERGIIEAEATSTLNVLPVIVSSSEAALDSAINAVTNCGFLDPGDAQVQALINALTKLKQATAETVTEATNAAKNVIEETVQVYGDLARTNAETSEGMAGNI